MSLFEQIQKLKYTPTPRSYRSVARNGHEMLAAKDRAAEWKRLSDMLWTLQIEIVRMQLAEEDAERVSVLEAEVEKIEWARMNLKSEYWRTA